MVVNDPIADMLTRIRNGLVARHESVTMPTSRMIESIANILLDEGYIKSFDVTDEKPQGNVKITLKYGPTREQHVISGLKRISKPGLRVYAKADKVPRVLGGLGIAILSTSKGVMSDKQARAASVGGEVLAYIW